MPTRRIVLLAVAACATLAVPAPDAQAATPAKLALTSVSSPPRAISRGDTFTVQGRVTNRGGRTATALLSFSLRRSARSRRAISIGGGRVVNRIRPGRTLRYRARLRLDPGVGEARRYVLVACVRTRRGAKSVCRAAKRSTLVGGPVARLNPPTRRPAQLPPLDNDARVGQSAPQPVGFSSGQRSAGDELFPQIGNGGYDALRYELALDYTPATKRLDGVATITMLAQQNLSDFSLDLSEWNAVESVAVAGAPATHQHDGTKLIVTPAQGILNGTTFDVVVRYGGTQEPVIDPDGSIEGWIPTGDGAYVVNEPIGAQGWFPNNNHPRDKALYDMRITVPEGVEVIANGRETQPPTVSGGRQTWYWSEDSPMASYLTTASTGQFDLTREADPLLPAWYAIDSAYTPLEKATALTNLQQGRPMIDWLTEKYGPYPFTSTGGIVDRSTGAGYALESQTRPNYPSSTVMEDTYLHELAHQWYGNSVSPGTWSDIWLNEGPAEFSAWWWQEEERAGEPTDVKFDRLYAEGGSPANEDFWDVPPANPTPEELFNTDAMYTRGAMVLEALRQILGEPVFLDMMRTWEDEHRYSFAFTDNFIELVKRKGDPAKQARFDEFFAQWLYGTTKPTITPDTF